MAGILDGLDIPKWMTPQDWALHSETAAAATGEAVSRGVGHALSAMSMIQRANQAAQGLALKKDEFNKTMGMNEQKLALAKQKQDLTVEAQKAQMRDTSRLQKVGAEWLKGKFEAEPETPFETLPGMGQAEVMRTHLMTRTAEGQAEMAINKRYGEIISHDANAWTDLKSVEVQFGKHSPEWNAAYTDWGDRYDAGLKADFQAKEKVIGDREAMVAGIKGDTTLETTALRVQGMIDAAKARSSGQPVKLSTLDGIKARGMVHDLDLVEKEIDTEKARGGWKILGGGPRSDVQKHLEERKSDLEKKLNDLGLDSNPKAMPSNGSPEAKAAKANAIAKEHPDWSRQKIIDETNRLIP